jgi:hypothetical protein
VRVNNASWIEGATFFVFFKKGGLSNVIDLFKWIAGVALQVDESWDFIYGGIVEEITGSIKTFMISMLNSRSSDQHIQSLALLNMNSDFDNAKHLY